MGSYKDYNILGSILGSPYFGKLPYQGPHCHGNSEFENRTPISTIFHKMYSQAALTACDAIVSTKVA